MTNTLNIVAGVLLCSQCNQSMTNSRAYSETLVGYSGAPAGHVHDDNCKGYYFKCTSGSNHIKQVFIVRTCATPGCNWTGRESCFCHPEKKVKTLPKD